MIHCVWSKPAERIVRTARHSLRLTPFTRSRSFLSSRNGGLWMLTEMAMWLFRDCSWSMVLVGRRQVALAVNGFV